MHDHRLAAPRRGHCVRVERLRGSTLVFSFSVSALISYTMKPDSSEPVAHIVGVPCTSQLGSMACLITQVS